MKKIANKSIPLFQLEESHLESKYRSEGFTYMIVNGYEVRWPRWENFVAALEDRTAEVFLPGGTWETLGRKTGLLRPRLMMAAGIGRNHFRGITKMVAGTNTANQGKEDSHEV